MTSNGLYGLMTDKLTPRIRELGIVALIAALCGATFVVDCLTPRGIPGWVLYTLPIVLTAWTSPPWSSHIVAACCAGRFRRR